MKKAWIGFLTALVVLTVGVTGVSAAGHGWRQQTADSESGCGKAPCARLWMDADGDGLCDRAEGVDTWCWTDADGDGLCDSCGAEPRSGECRYVSGGSAGDWGFGHHGGWGRGCRWR